LHANGTAMPEIEITRLLEEIGAAQDLAELAAIVSLAGESMTPTTKNPSRA